MINVRELVFGNGNVLLTYLSYLYYWNVSNCHSKMHCKCMSTLTLKENPFYFCTCSSRNEPAFSRRRVLYAWGLSRNNKKWILSQDIKQILLPVSNARVLGSCKYENLILLPPFWDYFPILRVNRNVSVSKLKCYMLSFFFSFLLFISPLSFLFSFTYSFFYL